MQCLIGQRTFKFCHDVISKNKYRFPSLDGFRTSYDALSGLHIVLTNYPDEDSILAGKAFKKILIIAKMNM